MNPERGTGRTQRLIVQSLCGMLMSKNVLHVMAREADVKEAMRYAEEWLTTNGWMNQKISPMTLDRINGRITFGHGTVRFVSAPMNILGLRPDLLLEDHYAVDLRLEREAKEQRMADCGLIAELLRKHGFSGVDLSTGCAQWSRTKG